MSLAAPSERRRAAVIYNPTKVDLEKLRVAVEAAEALGGWRTSLWLPTAENDPGSGQARRAAGEGVDVVLAAGGDGTVRAVAETLRGSTTALALLPSGTGNILARNLGLPLTHLDESVQTAFTGVDRQIDVGLAQLRIDYRVDEGDPLTMRAHTLLVGNCGTLPGNVQLLPDAAIDDGVFDVVSLRPEGLGGWVQIWLKIVWENGVLRRSSVGRKIMGPRRQVRTLRYLKASRIEVRLAQPEDFELDGDDFGTVIAFTARIDPLALRVRVPAAKD